MSRSPSAVMAIECRKIFRALVARIAAVAVLVLVSLTSIGGYAAAVHSPHSDLGRKAASMVSTHDWDGYTGLAALGLGASVLLSAGIVMAWTVGREFTDGTVVGLFAIPTSRGSIAAAKITVCAAWGLALVAAQSSISALGGIALGLPMAGALNCWLTLFAAGVGVIFSALPVMWVATRWRGYLPGIGATLAVVVTTNLAAGFGLGRYLPWAIPVLWATPGSHLAATALLVPVGVGFIGALATCRSWAGLQLGRG